MKTKIVLLFLALTTGLLNPVAAQKYTNTDMSVVKRSYNGIEFSSEKSLLENLSEAPGYTTYREFLEKHNDALMPEGFMGTVFVLPDSAFNFDPEDDEAPDLSNPGFQKEFLQFLIVPGRIDEHGLKKAAAKKGGTAYLSTLSGKTLIVRLDGSDILIGNTKGEMARVVGPDLYHKQGFLHIADAFVRPE